MTKLLSAVEGADILARHDLPIAPQAVVFEPREAVQAARRLGLPVVVKAIAEGLSHKTDSGGVVLNLTTPEAVDEAAHRLLAIGREAGDEAPGLLIQPMLSGVAEIIVGIQRDPVFGPVVLVGFGGIYTELYRDVALHLAPLEPAEAEGMLAELRAVALLDGFRGRPAADRTALIDLICKVGRIAVDLPIHEMDLNPVLVMPDGKGCVIVDNRVVIEA